MPFFLGHEKYPNQHNQLEPLPPSFLFLFFSSVSWSPFLGTGSYLVAPSPCTADLRANCLDKEQICVCVIKMGLPIPNTPTLITQILASLLDGKCQRAQQKNAERQDKDPLPNTGDKYVQTMKLRLLLFRLWLWLSPCSSPVSDADVFGHLDLIKRNTHQGK